MGRITGKKQKLNYKPILLVGGIGIPLVVVLAVLITPAPWSALKFERPPAFSPQLTARGALQIRWQTNLPSQGTVHFRYRNDQRWQQTVTRTAVDHVASIPGQAGEHVEFYVQAKKGRDALESEHFTVVLQPAVATSSAPGGKSP